MANLHNRTANQQFKRVECCLLGGQTCSGVAFSNHFRRGQSQSCSVVVFSNHFQRRDLFRPIRMLEKKIQKEMLDMAFCNCNENEWGFRCIQGQGREKASNKEQWPNLHRYTLSEVVTFQENNQAVRNLYISQ